MAKRRHNGEGTVYQRADGLWVATMSLGYVDGKRKRKAVAAKSAAEARAKLRALEATVDAGLPAGDHRLTVDHLLDRWLGDVMARTVASPALANYRSIAEHHIRPTLGKLAVAKLTSAEIDALLARKIEAGLSVSTVRRIRAVLSQALTQAVRWRIVAHNAAQLSRPPKEQRREGRGMSQAECDKFLAAARGHRLEVLFLTMLGTGLRRGEALGLQWEDVDLDEAVLYVRRQLRREEGAGAGLSLVTPKTAASKGAVYLPQIVVDALRARREADGGNVATGFVFASRTGGPLDPRNVSREFKAVAVRAGIGDSWHIHELRHSTASFMLRAGVPIKDVSEAMRHSSIRVTADTYGHIDPPRRQAAAAALDAVLGAGS